MGSLWLVGRFGPGDHQVSWGRCQEIGRWVESLGLDASRMLLCAAVMQRGEQYELHLTELVPGEDGKPHLDCALDRPVTRPVVVPVEPDTWPAWIVGMGNTVTGEPQGLPVEAEPA